MKHRKEKEPKTQDDKLDARALLVCLIIVVVLGIAYGIVMGLGLR